MSDNELRKHRLATRTLARAWKYKDQSGLSIEVQPDSHSGNKITANSKSREDKREPESKYPKIKWNDSSWAI